MNLKTQYLCWRWINQTAICWLYYEAAVNGKAFWVSIDCTKFWFFSLNATFFPVFTYFFYDPSWLWSCWTSDKNWPVNEINSDISTLFMKYMDVTEVNKKLKLCKKNSLSAVLCSIPMWYYIFSKKYLNNEWKV